MSKELVELINYIKNKDPKYLDKVAKLTMELSDNYSVVKYAASVVGIKPGKLSEDDYNQQIFIDVENLKKLIDPSRVSDIETGLAETIGYKI